MAGFFASLRSAGQMRHLVRDLRTEASGPAREAIAIGVGVFIGCTPLYGFHLLMCYAVGRLFRLNRLKLYVAANISNPFLAPLLLFTELQSGAFLRRGAVHPLTLETVRGIDPWSFGTDLVVGSLALGTLLGVVVGGTTWLLTREGSDDGFYAGLVRRASDRFVASSIIAWEFARGKLKGDPIYRAVLNTALLPGGATLVDVGCGSGLTLALLAEASAAWRGGEWPRGAAGPPLYGRLVGIELRSRAAALARHALGDAATIFEGDACELVLTGFPLPASRLPPGQSLESATHGPDAGSPSLWSWDAVLFFDVLHMMPPRQQEDLLSTMADLLLPGGVMLVREADAGAGLPFRAVRAGNRLKALAFGHWRQTFHFRTAAEWTGVFERLGFRVTRQDAGDGTPFANVLFVLRKRIAHGAPG